MHPWVRTIAAGRVWALIGLVLLGVGCNRSSSPTGPGNVTISGVWEGRWVSGQNQGEGILCVEFRQNDARITGRLFMIVRGLVGTFNGAIDGNDVLLNVTGGWQFSGSVTGNVISGTYQGGADTGTWQATLNPAKTECAWADPSVQAQFTILLGRFRPPKDAETYTRFITVVPTLNVQVNGMQAPNWWICIWEIDDRTRNEQFTLGAAFGRHPDGNRDAGVAWWTAKIHVQEVRLDVSPANGGTGVYDDNLANGFGGPGTDVYISTDGRYAIQSDSDPGYQREPIYRSACENGTVIEVRDMTLTGALRMGGRNVSSNSVRVQVPATGSFQNLPALHILVRAC